MRTSAILILILSAFLLCYSASAESDYFSRITMASDGRIMRFSHSPISVYVAEPPVAREFRYAYMDDVEYALEQWMGCSEGKLKFEQTDSEEADIRIYWAEKSTEALGEASLIRFDSGKFYVQMYILLEEQASLKTSLHKNLKAVLLHEIGHSIGLWGHSRTPGDIMYYRSGALHMYRRSGVLHMYNQSAALHPTRRDKSTLMKLLAAETGSAFHKNAIAEIKSDLSREPGAAHLHFWLGTVYADMGEDTLAIGELLTALRLSPDLLRAASRLGRIFQREGMYEMAIAYYSKEVDVQPSPGLHGLIGMLYLRQEKYAKAIDYSKKALAMDENFAEAKTNALAAYHRWASSLIENDQKNEAISVLLGALEMFPSSRVVHYDLGIAYDSCEKYVEAIEEYKKVLEIEPSFVAAKSNIASCMNNLGAKKIRNKNWEDSIEFCDQALEWDPDCWEAHKNLEAATLGLGREKHQAGLLDEAEKCYNAVLDMSPENLAAYSNLGYVFYEKGTYNEALEQFQTALSIDPEFNYAAEGLAIVKRRININKAKMAGMLTAISMLLCFSVISLSRYHHRKKRSELEQAS